MKERSPLMRKLLLLSLALTIFSIKNISAQPAPSINFTPVAFSFPVIPLGATSEPFSVVLTPSSLNSFQIRLADPIHFQIVEDTCTTEPLQTGASCKISLVFRPDQFGHYVSALALLDTSGELVNYVPIEGFCTDLSALQTPASLPPTAQVLISAEQLDFASLAVGSASDFQTATLSNVGSSPLQINGVTIGGDDPASFSFLETCSLQVILPGGTCTISANFMPAVPGPLQVGVAISGNIDESPRVLKLLGLGEATTPTNNGSCSLGSLAAPGWLTTMLPFVLLALLRKRSVK